MSVRDGSVFLTGGEWRPRADATVGRLKTSWGCGVWVSTACGRRALWGRILISRREGSSARNPSLLDGVSVWGLSGGYVVAVWWLHGGYVVGFADVIHRLFCGTFYFLVIFVVVCLVLFCVCVCVMAV